MKSTKGKMICAVGASMVLQLCIGIVYMWSALKSDIALSYGWNPDSAGMVYSYMLMTYVVGNLVGGIINDKKGPKVTCLIGVILFVCGMALSALAKPFGLFVLTYAIMGGMGSGLAYGACISCIQKWMPDKMGLATGLACCSFGLSTVIFTPVINSMMNANRDADGLVNFVPVFLVVAGIVCVVGLIAVIFITLPPEAQAMLGKKKTVVAIEGAEVITAKGGAQVTINPDGSRTWNFTLLQAMKTPAFWALFVSILLINGAWNLCVPLIKDLGIVRGLSVDAAVLCVSFTGIANAAGRLLMAALSDKFGRYSMMYILCVMNVVGAALMTFITGAGYFGIILMLAFAFGGPSSLNAAMSTDLFGPKNSGANYGAAMLAVGISSIIFNFISEHILHASVDAQTMTSNGIVATFIMAAVTAVVPFFMMLYISHYLKVRDEKLDKNLNRV